MGALCCVLGASPLSPARALCALRAAVTPTSPARSRRHNPSTLRALRHAPPPPPPSSTAIHTSSRSQIRPVPTATMMLSTFYPNSSGGRATTGQAFLLRSHALDNFSPALSDDEATTSGSGSDDDWASDDEAASASGGSAAAGLITPRSRPDSAGSGWWGSWGGGGGGGGGGEEGKGRAVVCEFKEVSAKLKGSATAQVDLEVRAPGGGAVDQRRAGVVLRALPSRRFGQAATSPQPPNQPTLRPTTRPSTTSTPSSCLTSWPTPTSTAGSLTTSRCVRFLAGLETCCAV